jgi:hypothetical protein
MKKNLIALLIVALVAVGLFATPANPSNATFDVTTEISPINEMKLTTSALSSPYPISLTGVDGFASDVTISSTGSTTAFTAYISALSNNKKGFTVKMSATPMVSTTDSTNTYEIDYTVAATLGSGESAVTKSYATNGSATSVDVFDQGAITTLTGLSAKLSVAVDSASFAAAIEDDYKGTVTFTYVAK